MIFAYTYHLKLSLYQHDRALYQMLWYFNNSLFRLHGTRGLRTRSACNSWSNNWTYYSLLSLVLYVQIVCQRTVAPKQRLRRRKHTSDNHIRRYVLITLKWWARELIKQELDKILWSLYLNFRWYWFRTSRQTDIYWKTRI